MDAPTRPTKERNVVKTQFGLTALEESSILIDFNKSRRCKISKPSVSALSALSKVAAEATKAMPEESWWGLKFLDVKYLFNWSSSPNVEMFRVEADAYKVKISGSHALDPMLTKSQLSCLEFLGWSQLDTASCDCFFSPISDAASALQWFESAVEVIQIVLGVSQQCAIVGSNDFVNGQLHSLEETRWSRKMGGYRLSSEAYNRIDLR